MLEQLLDSFFHIMRAWEASKTATALLESQCSMIVTRCDLTIRWNNEELIVMRFGIITTRRAVESCMISVSFKYKKE